MAAYAALVSLLNNIDQITKHPTLSTSLDNEQIQPLVDKAGFLLKFIEGYNYGGDSKEAGDVERHIASAAHAAEDVIETHIVDQIHDGSSLKFSYLITLLLKCTGCHVEASDTSKNMLHLQHIIEDMDAVIEKATVLKEKQGGSREVHSRAAVLMETGESSTRMVGLDDELIQLLDELTGYQSNRHTISIVGMGGMGKTTLAKNVYENLLIKEHFQFRAWATVAEQYNAENILSQLLSGLGVSTSTGTVGELGEQLHKTLSGRRYLIVLDDVWSVEAWDTVRRFFPDNRNRSRVVLTTRMSNVAKDCSSSVFKMKLLDEGRSWNLFCEKVFQHGDCPSQLEVIGKEIVELCKGLALSIVVIGGLLLKAPRTVEYWENVAEDIKSIPDSKEKQESLDVLSLSYSHLPPHLKPCFLYMGVFEEDSQIRVSNIIKLWIAEGFIKPDGGRVLEEIADGYLMELIDRNLISVGKLRQNGKIGSCGIHDLLRDLCLKVAKQQDFFHVSRGMEGGPERRLVCTWYLNQKRRPLARSIVTQRNCGSDPVQYRLLRVLHLSWYRFSPKELYGNVNLRYLAYKHPYDKHRFWKLPSSVSLVWNLQSLIIKDDYLSFPTVVAPAEIWKMWQLRHLKCHRIYLPDPPLSKEKDDSLILYNLRTLKRATNLRLSEEVCKIIPNIKKLDIVYHCDFNKYDDGLIECVCNLGRLHELESLNLSITSSRWPTPDPDMVKKLKFPRSLNKLSLSNCQLHWDDLTIIGSLPQLQVLKLEFYSVTVGERWSPIEGQFQSLKFLKIDRCNLSHWDADSSHFPVLENLILYGLQDLKEIPVDMGEIATLKLIRVDLCRESAAVSAVKIKEDQLEIQGNNDLQIQIKIRTSRLESLKERLEAEELTLDNCQLEIL